MFVPEIEVWEFHWCHVSIHNVSPVVHVQRQTNPSQETRRKSRAQGSRLRPGHFVKLFVSTSPLLSTAAKTKTCFMSTKKSWLAICNMITATCPCMKATQLHLNSVKTSVDFLIDYLFGSRSDCLVLIGLHDCLID